MPELVRLYIFLQFGIVVDHLELVFGPFRQEELECLYNFGEEPPAVQQLVGPQCLWLVISAEPTDALDFGTHFST